MSDPTETWQPTACILCSTNCGIEVQVQDRQIVRVRGDRRHPSSAGYACEKAQRLPHYPGGERLRQPQRRRKDGRFEAVSWETAIAEVAERLAAVRDEHGGASILYYGGGAQGNHLGGMYGRATRTALGSIYASSAFAQEKTGEAWVNAQLFGSVRHTSPGLAHAEVAVFVGKNPWQTHGFPRARVVLKEISRDPERTLIVIDPRRSETAEIADIHLQPRPGTDASLLGAMLAVLVEEELVDQAFLAAHASGHDSVLSALEQVDVSAHCERAGVKEELARAAARRIGEASSAAIFEDLGIQQAPHSTLNSYLEKLLWALTGNFGKRGAMNIHSAFAPGAIVGRRAESRRVTPVTGERVIGGFIPAASIPETILTDDPSRFRALIVESSNPVHSLPGSAQMREALAQLDFSVVIDIAMTETGRCADYVLPSASQYEKWECTFFNVEFPDNVFHLRAPVADPPSGLLGEPEIHRRLVRALGALTDADVAGLREAAESSREAFAAALAARLEERPDLKGLLPIVLYETLGPTLPDGAQAAAALWLAAQACAAAYPQGLARAGIGGEGASLGDALFDAVIAARSGLTFTREEYEDCWGRLEHQDGRLHLAIPELLEELEGLLDSPPIANAAYPFVLAAGERRRHTANTVFRDTSWRKHDRHGALRISPADAAELGLLEGARVRIETPDGSAVGTIEITDTLRRGHITLPNGHGLPTGHSGELDGVPPNELTSARNRDWLSGTPWNKHVPARIEALG
jgi:anaerobic selenocysteine-containing dehydrogenase